MDLIATIFDRYRMTGTKYLGLYATGHSSKSSQLHRVKEEEELQAIQTELTQRITWPGSIQIERKRERVERH